MKRIDAWVTFFDNRPLYMDIFFILGIVFFFTGSWLNTGLSGEDFPGNVSLIWNFKKIMAQ